MKRGLIAGSDPSVVAALQVLLYGQVCIDSLRDGNDGGVLDAVRRRTYDWVMVENARIDSETVEALAERTHVIVVGADDEAFEASPSRAAGVLPSGTRLSDRLRTVLAAVH